MIICPAKGQGVGSVVEFQEEIRGLIDKYFSSASVELKRCFPRVLSGSYNVVSFVEDGIFCLSFVSDVDVERVKLFLKRKKKIYPNLFTSDAKFSDNSLMTIGSMMMLVSGFRAEPRKYVFYFKRDSSLCIDNLIVKMPSPVLGKNAYTLDLVYLVSCGDKVNEQNIVDHLEDFFRSSIVRWRARSS